MLAHSLNIKCQLNLNETVTRKLFWKHSPPLWRANLPTAALKHRKKPKLHISYQVYLVSHYK